MRMTTDESSQLDDGENESEIIPTVTSNNLNSSSSSNVSNTQKKEEPLVVKVKDILTGEVTTQKMQPDRVWNLEKKIKIIVVELNGDGQGSDNGSNLLAQSAQNVKNQEKLKVSHAGGSKSNARRGRQMEQKLGRPVCRSEVVLSTLLKKNGNYINEQGKILADKISEYLPKDQERAATLGVPLKILAHPNDAIGKVYGVEHSGRVRGVGGSICPSAAFGIPRHSISHTNIGSSNSMPHQRVEDLEKHVEALKEKLTGYEETKEKLEETKKWLVQNETHLATLHRFLQAKFGSELPTFNLDSS